MSTAAASGLGVPMRWADYDALDGRVRGEYIDGTFVMTPAPSRQHQNICHRLVSLLEPVSSPNGVIAGWGWLTGGDEFVPDVMVHPPTEDSARFTGLPRLVVEVLSGNRADDLVVKATKYAAAGLADYWVVDPRDHVIETFALAGDAYRSTGLSSSGTVTLSFGKIEVSLDIDALFR